MSSQIVPWAALALSLASIAFTVFSWLQNYRPIVTARVETKAHGNQGIFLDLVVENSGTRPAKNVRLVASERDLAAAFDPGVPDEVRAEIRAAFSAKFMIPVLANQARVSNAFGLLAPEYSVNKKLNAWRWHHRLPVRITYESLRGRRFTTSLDLFLADSTGFASVSWGDGKDR